MENPVARPGSDVAAAEPPLKSPKAGTIDKIPAKPTPPASDIGMAETGVQQSKTQPMEGAPKRPPQNEAERVDAIRNERNSRIEAEKRYQDADAAFDKAQADFKKVENDPGSAARAALA